MSAALLTGVLTFLKPAEEADRHHRAGDQSLVVRNRVRLFRTIDLTLDKSESELVSKLKRLAEERHAVLKTAPLIPAGAYQKANTAIEVSGESRHRVDAG